MFGRSRAWCRIIISTVTFLAVLGAAGPARAHDVGSAGTLEIVFGWEQEPAYSGIPNAVHVTVRGEDGQPVVDDAAQLTVTVIYGGLAMTRPLVPLDGPGEYRAVLVPTEPGTYSFQIMGSIGGESVDLTSTCSDATFHCVADPSEIRFPGAGAEVGDTGTGVGQIVAAPSHADGSVSIVAIVAIVLATLACVGVGLIAIGAWQPRRPREGSPST